MGNHMRGYYLLNFKIILKTLSVELTYEVYGIKLGIFTHLKFFLMIIIFEVLTRRDFALSVN